MNIHNLYMKIHIFFNCHIWDDIIIIVEYKTVCKTIINKVTNTKTLFNLLTSQRYMGEIKNWGNFVASKMAVR